VLSGAGFDFRDALRIAECNQPGAWRRGGGSGGTGLCPSAPGR
jgi:hypothetical protein